MSRTGIETKCLSPNFLYVYVYVCKMYRSSNPQKLFYSDTCRDPATEN